MAKIKVAVIGAGMMGKNHLKTYKSLPNVELVGVYDIFPEAAQKAAETFGVKENDIVAVKIESAERTAILCDTVIRVSDKFALAMHIDTDESNAVGAGREQYGEIVKL